MWKYMIETIAAVNQAVNSFIWGIPAMVCIIGVGLLLSVRTGFLQIRKFPYAIRTTVGRMFRKRDASDGAMTPFQAVCTALAGTVGTGNIAGVAGAIAIGGPGAVFWMWCSALLGMCTKFAEVTLAVHFRERSDTGEWVGGPMYYIKNGLGRRWQFLAVLYALFGVLTVFGTGNATQVNTIVAAVDTALLEYGLVGGSFLPTLNLIVGILVAVLVALVLLGGIKRIGSVSEKLVPFMALFYIVLSVGVVVLNFSRLPYVLESIVAGAFNPAAFTGGTIGSLFVSMQKGVSRGIFSNEAGLGTGSIAHACADTKKPVKQGMFGIFEVFADTIVICTLTAMTIICSGVDITFGQKVGSVLSFIGSKMGWIQEIIGTVMPVVADILTSAWSVISPIIDIAISVFKVLFNVVQTVFNGIASVISSVWDKIRPVVEGIGNGLSWIADKVGGLFGFGGGGGGETGSNAEGTNNWRGGPTGVGEQGPELIDLPRGTRILPNKESVQLASSLQRMRAATAAQNAPSPVPANAPIRRGGSSSPAASVIRLTLAKLADTIVVREEADIDKIGEKVAKEVVLAVKNMVPAPA